MGLDHGEERGVVMGLHRDDDGLIGLGPVPC